MSARVGIIVGSKSDLPYAEEAVAVLGQLGIEYELRVLSAHRTPGPLEEYVASAMDRGVAVFITMAGHAAALPGVVAARMTAPVIGVPLPTSDLAGQDALMAIVQMPTIHHGLRALARAIVSDVRRMGIPGTPLGARSGRSRLLPPGGTRVGYLPAGYEIRPAAS